MKNSYPLNLIERCSNDDLITLDYKYNIFGISKLLLEFNVEREINKLKDKYKKVIISRYKDNKTFKQIGQELKISSTRVSQIHSKCIRILKSPDKFYNMLNRKDEKNVLLDSDLNIQNSNFSKHSKEILQFNNINTVNELLEKSSFEIYGLKKADKIFFDEINKFIFDTNNYLQNQSNMI